MHGLEDLRELSWQWVMAKAKGIIHYSLNTHLQGGVMALLVYADDIIVTWDNDKERCFLSRCLAKEFEMKALGRLKYLFCD